MIKVNWEYTDTFGGEANYAWCKRGTFPAHDDASDRRIVCAAKLAAGLNGCRCKRETLGGGGLSNSHPTVLVLFFLSLLSLKGRENRGHTGERIQRVYLRAN